VARLKALEGRRRATRSPMTEEERALDHRVRNHPRTDATDPYRAGMRKLAMVLQAKLGDVPLVVAYNEFCAPSLEDAIEELVARGATRIDVVPSMVTPGGVHAEIEIPETIEAMQREGVEIVYAWPFSLDDVAELLAGALRRSASSRALATKSSKPKLGRST
jgi:sirohydrochlorin cobaltochelatase